MSRWQRVTEFVDGIIPTWSGLWSGLRSPYTLFKATFWGTQPAYDNSQVNYGQARSMYRNDNCDENLGTFFSRPIIDLQVNFMGLPVADVDDEEDEDFLNKCLSDYWAPEIQQMLRNSIRDSETVVRLRLPDIDDPLMTMEERMYGKLEIVDPERVILQERPGNTNVIDTAYIEHKIVMIEEDGDIINGVVPKEKEHEIIEVVNTVNFRYYDKTERRWMPEFEMPNNFGFVPFMRVYNEYESSLSGGQSDLEPIIPFVKAFHDVLSQSLMAHKYHSVPKIKFKLQEVGAFIRNNFPEAWDQETGTIKPDAKVNWSGREIVFLQSEEDAEFIEARSVLNDSRELLNFLIDCIVVVSETPRWAFMLVDAGSANQANNAQSLPFSKKIERKRRNFAPFIQKLLKMIEAVNGMTIICPKITWETQRVDELAAEAQAVQQLTMGLEVMAQRQIISDETYRAIVRQFLPQMKNPKQEAADAKDNFDALALAVDSQNTPAGGNGKGNSKNVAPVTSGSQGRNE